VSIPLEPAEQLSTSPTTATTSLATTFATSTGTFSLVCRGHISNCTLMKKSCTLSSFWTRQPRWLLRKSLTAPRNWPRRFPRWLCSVQNVSVCLPGRAGVASLQRCKTVPGGQLLVWCSTFWKASHPLATQRSTPQLRRHFEFTVDEESRSFCLIFSRQEMCLEVSICSTVLVWKSLLCRFSAPTKSIRTSPVT